MTEWTRRDHHRVLGLLAAGCVALLLAAAPVARLGAHRGAEQHDGLSPSTADIVRFLEQATWGPTAGAHRARAEVGFEGVPRRAVQRAGVELSDAAALSHDARYGRRARTARLPARQLHAVSAAEPVLRQRAVRRRISCGSGSRSRCTRSSWSRASRSRSRAGWRRTCRCSTATRSATTGSCSTRSR